MKVQVNTNQFFNSHGKAPRGDGHWFFFMGDNDDVMDAFQHVGSFAASKKAAVKEAKKRGVSSVTVGS